MLYQHAQLVLGQIYILDFCNIPQLNSRNHEIFFRCTSFSKAIMMIVCAHSLRYYTYYYYVFLAFVRLSHSMCHGALLTIDLPIYSKVLQNNLFVFNCKFYKKILDAATGDNLPPYDWIFMNYIEMEKFFRNLKFIKEKSKEKRIFNLMV